MQLRKQRVVRTVISRVLERRPPRGRGRSRRPEMNVGDGRAQLHHSPDPDAKPGRDTGRSPWSGPGSRGLKDKKDEAAN
jgi:hypothetical protein